MKPVTRPINSSSAKAESSTGGVAAAGLSLPARLEAILYLKGRAVTLKELAQLAGCSCEEAATALMILMADYAHRETALEIRQDGDGYSLQLRADLAELVHMLVPLNLGAATLRTLATIALKQPIRQAMLVDMRGSGAYEHVKELLAQGFITRRREQDGRSYWLTLTEKFHRTYAVLPLKRQSSQEAESKDGGQQP
ncbi:MAG: SMC-Scp complex subunit ScpB [Synechococcus sp. SB0665_bin_28]|nr:SMC-Scp complex subunit ScpB [Synechococcus sp. SB0665_bin_28]MYF20427.1 SMC-Scp complex subunit ScpB [Synechococcus sp. SB0677_bin_5]